MRSILWTYLLCVSTFGIYALVWIYRAARQTCARERSVALGWALGSVAAPIACAVLYEISRCAGEREPPRSPSRHWLAPALHAAIASLLFLSPLRTLWLPVWLLMPIPLLVVHSRLAAAGGASPGDRFVSDAAPPVAEVGWRRRAGEGVAIAIGVPALVFATGWLDQTDARILLARGRDGTVEGVGARYQLEVPPAWLRVEAGTIGDPESDLELVTRDASSWIIVYGHGLELSIDDAVDARRELIASQETVWQAQERRFFVDAKALVTGSLAHYRVGESLLTRGEYVVLTARLRDALVEVVGFTTGPPGQLDQLVELVSSLRPLEPLEPPGDETARVSP